MSSTSQAYLREVEDQLQDSLDEINATGGQMQVCPDSPAISSSPAQTLQPQPNTSQQIVYTPEIMSLNNFIPTMNLPFQPQVRSQDSIIAEMNHENQNYAITKKYERNLQENYTKQALENKYRIMTSTYHYALETPLPNKLEIPLHNLSQYNLDIFMENLNSYISWIKEGTKLTDIGSLFAILSCISASLQGRIIAVCNEESWEEPAIIWTINIGESGIGKTNAFEKLISPFRTFENLHSKNNHTPFGKRMLRSIIEKTLNNLAKNCDINDQQQVKELPDKISQIMQSEVYKDAMQQNQGKLLFTNGTIVGLRKQMSQNGGMALCMTSEAGGITDMWKKGDLGLWAKSYNQEPENYTSGRTAISMPDPTLIMNLGIQPGILLDLCHGKFAERLHHAGIWARFLPVYNSSYVNNSNTPICIGRDEKNLYDEKILGLLKAFHTTDQSAKKYKIYLDENAKNLLNGYKNECKAWQEPSQPIRAWLAKAPAHAVRIATAMHFFLHGQDGINQKIGGEWMNIAIQLIRIVYVHVNYIFSDMGMVAEKNAQKIIDSLNRNSDPFQKQKYTDPGITTTDIQQRMRMDRIQINNALRLLEAKNWCVIHDDGSGRLLARFRPEVLNITFSVTN